VVKPATLGTVLLAASVAALSACTSNQPASNQPSTSSTSGTATSVPPGTQRLSTQLKTADGTPVANATFDFANGYATVTVETVAAHILSPGFHGMHVHSVGKCEANSVAPAGGPPGDFDSAGGHYQVPGHTGHPASGDLTSIEVRGDGGAKLVTTTDSVTAADLLGGEGTALIIHQGPDNFGNIPDRYTSKSGAPGPDQETLATGDAGKRVACGVIGTETATTPTTTNSTTANNTTAGNTSTTGGATTGVPSIPGGTSTSTSTVTETVPSPTSVSPGTTTQPSNPGQPGNAPAPGGG
jgi:Cu-Zn family superoxide dismutase